MMAEGRDNASFNSRPSKEFESWVTERSNEFLREEGVTSESGDYPKLQISDEVNPEMRVTNFYEGASADAHHMEEHEPEANFSRQKKLLKGWEVKLEDSFSEKDGEIPDSVTLVGPAGSGKTMAMKRYLRDHAGVINIVLCGRDFAKEELKTTVFDFIFPDKSRISEETLKEGYEWMKANPEKVNFFIDSLDTLPFTLSCGKLVSEGEGLHSNATILSSIMARSLFSGCKIFSSSREYGIIELPEELRADRIISLIGLSKESIRKHISSVLGDSGMKFCDTVEKRHPGLWILLSTPVFLVFTLIGHLSSGASKLVPTTMSRVMVDLLLQLSRSVHGIELTNVKHKEAEEMVKLRLEKLKELSYNGIVDGKVTFAESDLKRVHLEEASALSIAIPWKDTSKIKLFKGKRLFFCHQSIQEFFSALWILGMNFKDFQNFVRKNLRQPRLSVVRRFLAGLLLSKEVLEVVKENELIPDDNRKLDGVSWEEDMENKRGVLKQFLKDELKSSKKKWELLDLYITLSEADEEVEEVIKEAIRCIDLYALSCSPSDMHAIGSVVRYCAKLRLLNISQCDLNPEKMDALTCGLGDERNGCKVTEFRLSDNDELGEEGICKLRIILEKLESFDNVELRNCGIDTSWIEKFAHQLKSFKLRIKVLDLSINHDADVTKEMTQAVEELILRITERLVMHGWTFNELGQKSLQNAMSGQDPPCMASIEWGRDEEPPIVAERLEDFYEKLLKERIFLRLEDVKKFARVKEGLRLSEVDIQEIEENHPRDSRAQKLEYFKRWNKTGRRSVRELRDIVEKYTKAHVADADEN